MGRSHLAVHELPLKDRLKLYVSPLKGFDKDAVDVVSHKMLTVGKYLELDIHVEGIHEVVSVKAEADGTSGRKKESK